MASLAAAFGYLSHCLFFLITLFPAVMTKLSCTVGLGFPSDISDCAIRLDGSPSPMDAVPPQSALLEQWFCHGAYFMIG